MPWTPAQIRLAEAVKAGKSDKFSHDVADKIISESKQKGMTRRDVDDDGYAKGGGAVKKGASSGMAGRLKRYRRL